MKRRSSRRLRVPVGQYTVLLSPEPEGGYTVTVPALPGCVTHGDDVEAAKANAREAIQLYIEDCVAAGDPVPQEAGKEFIEVGAAS